MCDELIREIEPSSVRGRRAARHTEGQSVLGESWAQFSFHVEGWIPGEDSLETFVIAAGRRLRETN